MPDLTPGIVNAATPTPLKPDGVFDRESAKKLCRRWVDIKLDGVLVLGTMGEGPYLPDAVRDAFMETAIEEVGDKVTVYAGAADVSRERMLERALRYAKMGAPCVVFCLPPKVAAPQAIDDVKALADACPVPCAYYDVPFNTGTPLVVGEIRDILSHPNIVVMKDSSNNALIHHGLVDPALRPADCFLMDGCEYHTAYTHMVGYDGCLHGGGVLTGLWVRRIWEAMDAGNIAEALALDHRKAMFLAKVYNRFAKPLQNTMGQKYALKLLGAMDNETVVIKQQLDDAARERIREAVEENREFLA